ncbi:hypothetical protein I6B53_03210 [Schaalia sp. 19OD2882]|uniref:DUF2746 domain-containing protein n=1 Tax=Schaalia sp. 19OD2882 TaxID=2794089 RepID=UPI001C1F0D7A|nr:DUF2746 domain-containing protein [Schaalia sp. 19OD2882]QWW20119.1 hypothetical protein I6B53_03210 [Schaalia sp. 19OD2882]
MIEVLADEKVATAVVTLLVAVLGLAAAGVGVGITYLNNLRRHLQESREDTKAIRESTVNSHSTNLREDVDALAGQVREGMTAISLSLRRADARAEREHAERVADIRLIREDFGRLRTDLQAVQASVQRADARVDTLTRTVPDT